MIAHYKYVREKLGISFGFNKYCYYLGDEYMMVFFSFSFQLDINMLKYVFFPFQTNINISTEMVRLSFLSWPNLVKGRSCLFVIMSEICLADGKLYL